MGEAVAVMVDFKKVNEERKQRMATKEKQTIMKEQVGTMPADVLNEPGGGAMATQTSGTLERRSFVPEGDKTGTEEIGLNEIKLPRLAIAQGLSYEMIPDDSRYIKGLVLFDMFNTVSQEIYGRGPVRVIPILREVHRIEYDPENRGVPLDLNVPAGDPRTLWTRDPENPKKGVPPKATTYEDFVILLVHAEPARNPEPMVLSIKCTNKFQTLAANRMNYFLKFQNCPIYGAYKSVETKSEKNDEGTFGVFVIKNDKRLDSPDQSDEEWNRSAGLYKFAKDSYDALKGKTIVTDHEPVSATDFDYGENAGGPGTTSDAGANAPKM